jgi:hypothetical protein
MTRVAGFFDLPCPESLNAETKGVDWFNWPCGQNAGRSPKPVNAR